MSSAFTQPSTAITAASSSITTIGGAEPLKFILFPKMPLELRNMIWTEVCFHERLIDIWIVPFYESGSDEDKFFDDLLGAPAYTYKSYTNRTPSILHTSQEARTTGLKHYSLDLGARMVNLYRGGILQISSPPRIYVNWECDIICPMTQMAEENELLQEVLLLDFGIPFYFPRLSRMAFVVEDSLVSCWLKVVIKRHNIKEVILYPWGSYLAELHDEKDFHKHNQLEMKLVDFNESLEEKEYFASDYPGKRDYLLGVKEQVRVLFDTCKNKECKEESGECKNSSHLEHPFPINFKIMTISVTER
ncbi:hypothetical protein BKA65DRAFT_485258 [Rhexocercosporidium sp. MPI-PUGE-AT-0058]|nr:hypothetical protein BKA65DRAFT_485258 [Rhexocercosporidium sp. MPI-PUGE-AT-0058]